MTLRHRAALTAAALLALVSTKTHSKQQALAATAVPASQTVDVQGGRIRIVTIATGLVHPWSMAFLPYGRTLLVSERPGRLRVIRDGVLDPEPVWTATRSAC